TAPQNTTQNNTGGNKPPMEKQITISVSAACIDKNGSLYVDPKDSHVSLYRQDSGSYVSLSLAQGAAGYTFTPTVAGTYEARATKSGYLDSTLPFQVYDCTLPPACTASGLECATDTECCSAYCNQTSRLCQQRLPLATCAAKGGACTSTGDCCVGACVSGTCSVCSATLGLCRTSADCCEGYCSSNKCVLPSADTTIIGTLADKQKSQSLWPVVVGLAAIAAYAGATTGTRIIPPAAFALPIMVGFFSLPFLGILAAVAEIIIEKTDLGGIVSRLGKKPANKKGQ
ncbi:MAG TPA: hypothetical protein PLO51_00245, partial [Candidatus Micrarchaeota archaeon]|nr:hypothetical protein [Candidatus Micrarchaeota archaeon]